MADNWFEQNAPAPSSAQPQGGDWFADNKPSGQDQGSVAHEVGEGILDTTVRGALGTAKAILPKILTPAEHDELAKRTKDLIHNGHYLQAAKELVTNAVEATPGGRLITGTIANAADQFDKAKESAKRGEYGQAALHGAASIPVVGQMAAGGIDAALGSEAKYDKYGNVIAAPVAPNPARAAGNAIGLGLSATAPKGISKVVPKGKDVTVKVPGIGEDLTPAEQATVDFADRSNIPIKTSTRAGSKMLANVEASLENAPGSAGIAKRASEATKNAMESKGAELSQQVHPVAATPESAGTAIQDATAASDAKPAAIVQSAAQPLLDQAHPQTVAPEAAGTAAAAELSARRAAQSGQASDAYTRLSDIESDPANIKKIQIGVKANPELDKLSQTLNKGKSFSDSTPEEQSALIKHAPSFKVDTTVEPITRDVAVPVDMRTVKSALRPIYDDLKQQLPIAQQQASRGLKAIENIVNGEDHVSASTAEANLSAAKAIQREAVNGKSKYLAGQAISAMQPIIDSAVEGAGSDAIDALKQGRELTKAKYATQETIDALHTEPVKVFKQLTAPGDTAINLLRDVASKAPGSMPAVGRAYLEGLMESAKDDPNGAIGQWSKMGDATKKILFKDPDLRSNIDAFLKAAAKASEGKTKLPPEPVSTFNKATAPKDQSINLLREIEQKAPSTLPVAGRAFIDKLMDMSNSPDGKPGPGTAASEWAKMGAETKKILFTHPGLISDLDSYFKLAAKESAPVNTSRTAYVTGMQYILQHPVTGIPYVLRNVALAKLLYSKAGARLLTEGLRIPASSAASAVTANKILNLAGSGANPLESPNASPPAQIADVHKEGDTVGLKDIGKVVIKKINGDGTFDY